MTLKQLEESILEMLINEIDYEEFSIDEYEATFLTAKIMDKFYNYLNY